MAKSEGVGSLFVCWDIEDRTLGQGLGQAMANIHLGGQNLVWKKTFVHYITLVGTWDMGHYITLLDMTSDNIM